MRTWFGLAVVALLGLALSGRGGDAEDAGAATAPDPAFPVTIEHEYGSTTIETGTSTPCFGSRRRTA